MDIVLWILQIVLAAGFGLAGIMKVTQPKEKLSSQMPWVNDFSENTVRFIGTAEVLAAIGLILPWATDIAAWLTPLAAVGLAVVMALAMATHLRRGERQMVGMNAILLVLAVVVAIGRF